MIIKHLFLLNMKLLTFNCERDDLESSHKYDNSYDFPVGHTKETYLFFGYLRRKRLRMVLVI